MTSPQRLLASLFRAGTLGMLLFTAIGTSSETAYAQPSVHIVGGDTVNWGRIATDTLKREIKIVNVGKGILNITSVHPSCGCTTTSPLTKTALGPNDTATVGIAINVKGRSGQQHKTVDIITNDANPARDTVRMIFLADLVQDVTASSTMFPMIRDAKVDADYTSNLVLTNTSDGPVTIQRPVATTMGGDDLLKITFNMTEPKTLKPGETLELVATVRPLKPGMHNTDIEVNTSSKNTANLSLKLYTNVVNPDAAPKSAAAPAPKK